MILLKYLFIWLCWVFIAAHGFSLVAASPQSYFLNGVHGLLSAVASPVAEHRLKGAQASTAVSHGLSNCSL